MKERFIYLLLISVIVALALIGGCTVTHKTMRSSIVMKLADEAHICIGVDDGIKVGDILTVYRTKEVPLPQQAIVPDRSGRYQPKVKYEMVRVGRAKVTALLGEHYASVKPIDMVLEASDIFETTNRE